MNIRSIRKPITGTPASGTSSDFGLGNKIARKPGTRLINNDGSFNVIRKGRSVFAPYQQLVEMGWSQFLLLTVGAYVLVNLLFALLFLIIGVESLANVDIGGPLWKRYLDCFFFSVQTFTTVGYGSVAPIGITANALAAFIALFGLISVAMVTGLFYARFARPQQLILFSEKAIIAPYGESGGRSLQFRIANKRDSNLIKLSARLVLTWLEDDRRHFAPLELERDNVPLFPLNWTIVHPITKNSPIYGWTKQNYCHRHSELLITVDGYDETFAQSIHINNSYIHEEIEWNARFEPMYFEQEMTTELHLDRIHHFSFLEEE